MSEGTKQFNFTVNQIAKLMDMQDQLNKYIHPEWISQQFDWRLAMVDECMEIHGHLGWKWWRPNYQLGLVESNAAQVKLEVIDLLHFVLSQTLVDGINATATANGVNCRVYYSSDLPSLVNEFMADCLTATSSIRWHWAILAHAVGLTEQEVIETYTQKYVLNKFRQDHGYKDGSYVKEWQNGWLGGVVGGVARLQEDNEVLARIVHEGKLQGAPVTDEIALYSHLELAYNSRLNK